MTVKQNQNQSNLFEYKQQIPKSLKKKRIRNSQQSDSLLEGDPREFKVRIVERLTFLEQKINNKEGNAGSGAGYQHQNDAEAPSSDNLKEQVKNLNDDMLETLNREFVKRVLVKILERMKNEMSESERKNLLNQFDPNGATLLHYVTALNYYELIPVLHEYGADINIKSALNQLSPLMIAAAKGHEKGVKKLMRLGAVFWNDSDEAS